MSLTVEPSRASCGAAITGAQLNQPLSSDLVAEIRAHWLEHKVVAFPDQQLTPAQLVAFSEHFGDIGQDPFFGHIDEHPQVAAIQRNADETTSIFAEIFHSDWSFMPVPPAATALYGITIPPVGGDTLFGRYWGCREQRRFLHFELCYYQAIDAAIARGLARVEAGAQGGHKLMRGYEPVETWSAHWIADPGLREAVAEYLRHERDAVAQDRSALGEHTPFREG